MKNIVYIAQSLDGYIAGPGGELDWLDEIENPEQSDFGFADFMEQIDALLMGRNTFEKVLSFGQWPYEKPVFVASNSLVDVPENIESKATVVSGSPQQLSEQLRSDGFETIYVDGGALIHSFLDAGLVDEIIVTTVPVILGDGIPLFRKGMHGKRLELMATEVLAGQLIKAHYRVLVTS